MKEAEVRFVPTLECLESQEATTRPAALWPVDVRAEGTVYCPFCNHPQAFEFLIGGVSWYEGERWFKGSELASVRAQIKPSMCSGCGIVFGITDETISSFKAKATSFYDRVAKVEA